MTRSPASVLALVTSLGFAMCLGLAERPASAQSVDPAPADSAPAYTPNDYRLGPQDKLRLRVFEWQTAKGEVREWTALSGSFVVSARGTIALPFLGEVAVEGRTTGALGTEIGAALQNRLGLTDRPQAAVEIEEHRPFYVTGRVRDPGAFAYRPGLTTLQAFSLAGGLEDRAAYGSRVTRDLISAKGNIDILAEERERLLVRRARIAAQTADTPLEPPALDGVSPERMASLVADERAIMDARNTSLEREVAALEDLEQLLTREIEGLRAKLVSLERQVELARKERRGVNKLSQQGLAVTARVLASERMVADMESRMLDMNTAILRAQQEIAKARQTAAGLRASHVARIAQERLDTEAELGRIASKLELQRGLRNEALTFAASSATEEETVAPRFALVRAVAGRTVRIAAEASTPVMPGDVLDVTIAPPTGPTVGSATIGTAPAPAPAASTALQATN